MKTIAFTQRVEICKKTNEIRDSLDQKWIDLASKLKLLPIILPNTDKKNISKLFLKHTPDIIILTGGNDIHIKNSIKTINISKKRDDFEIALIKYAIKKSVPLLGVCRGMQIINIFFKGKISQIKDHVNKKHKIYYSEKYDNYFTNTVNSFHNWGIKKKDLSTQLNEIAVDQSGNIESFVHKNKSIIGIMWHPERRNNKKDLLIFKKLINKK